MKLSLIGIVAIAFAAIAYMRFVLGWSISQIEHRLSSFHDSMLPLAVLVWAVIFTALAFNVVTKMLQGKDRGH
jgi:hypothetical protein